MTLCYQTMFDWFSSGKRVHQGWKRTRAQIPITITQRVALKSCYRTSSSVLVSRISLFFKGSSALCLTTCVFVLQKNGLKPFTVKIHWPSTLNERMRACFIFYILLSPSSNLSPVESNDASKVATQAKRRLTSYLRSDRKNRYKQQALPTDSSPKIYSLRCFDVDSCSYRPSKHFMVSFTSLYFTDKDHILWQLFVNTWYVHVLIGWK